MTDHVPTTGMQDTIVAPVVPVLPVGAQHAAPLPLLRTSGRLCYTSSQKSALRAARSTSSG